mmetsp:Transcript_3957/g.4039  ORF Transcript_3957/g.4039 Transcript_3957/m.4039 type:complete len:182 (+) Transcript_3957:163-708(+)
MSHTARSNQDTSNDADIARTLQQSYLQSVSETSKPNTAESSSHSEIHISKEVSLEGQIPIANPMQSQSHTQSQNIRTDAYGTPLTGPTLVPAVPVLSATEVRLLQVYSLSQGLSYLAIIDAIFLAIFVFINPFWLILIWGPFCGYIGAKAYRKAFMYGYLAYYALRLAGDIFLFISGSFFH